MKILQLCKKFPYPLKDGESVAVTFLAKALNELDCEVTLLAMNTTKHYINIEELPENFNHYKAIHTVDIDNRINPFDALKALLTGKNYFLSRFESEEYAQKIRDLLKAEDFDIIQFETLQTLIYFRDDIFNHKTNENQPKVVLRSHNVEHEIWERIVKNSKSGFKKWYLNRLLKQLKRFELEKNNQVDSLVAITQRDMNYFQKLGFNKIGHVTPIGLETSHYQPNQNCFEQRPTMSFIGSLDWLPNLEGVEWFLTKVMVKLQNIELHIAGRNMPQHLLELALKNVHIHGEVESSVDFINQHSIMIVPLFSGSGMRVKILEGLALGRVILTTSIGVEGIHAVDGKHLFIVNTVDEFIEKINYCIQNPEKLKAIGESGKRFVNEHFDNLKIAERLKEHYENLNPSSILLPNTREKS
ncbi:MAG: glycosyltransferase family 4 protein [Saprospiraceae bacterium]